MAELIPMMTDPGQRRKMIKQKILDGLAESFPMQSRNKTIELADLQYQEKDYSSSEQKKAILEGSSLNETVKGTVIVRDKEGKVIDKAKNFVLARVPYFTPRHTFILEGNEYSVSNMIRRKPGVYARKRANGILEASFNTHGGKNFRISMDPSKGEPQLEYGATKIPLYPILRRTGMSHDRIAQSWGHKLTDANQKNLYHKADQAVDKLYKKVLPEYRRDSAHTPADQMDEVVKDYTRAAMDPDVNVQTLGKGYKNVTPDSLLDASSKILRIFKDTDEVDDQDNLDFKYMVSVDDLFKERIKLDARDIAKKLTIKMEATPEVKKVLPAGPFSKGLRTFINTSQLASIPTQTNPMELIDSAVRVTSLGEGGISTERAVPIEARQTHVTQIGALDPIRTPESFRAGIDIRAAMLAQRDAKGNIYVPIYDVKTNRRKHIRAGKLQTAVVAFPNQKLRGTVDAVVNGVNRRVHASKVDYQIPHASFMYSPTTNLIPFLESAQGNRAVMGSKMQVQALSLVDREEPYIQVKAPGNASYEQLMGHIINPVSPVAGTVAKIDKDYIYIQPEATKVGAATLKRDAKYVKVPYDTDFPLAAKTYLNHKLGVKVGDRVKPQQLLADSNFTRNGTLALGKNMRVAFMPYYGANSNDAVVVSEGASKKLTSERMYKVVIPRDADLTFKKTKHQSYYGHGYTKDQYKPLDDEGVPTPGSKILPGNPVVVGLRKTQLSADDMILGKLHRSLVRPYSEYTKVWDHDHTGEVVDVVKTPKRIALTIKTREPAGIGDKLCYTEDTEVLTTEGWVPVAEVGPRTVCYTLKSSGAIELQLPTGLYYYPQAGELYELDSQQVKLRVTPNHDLYVKPRGASKYQLKPARETIHKRVRHKKNGKWLSTTPEVVTLPPVLRKTSGRIAKVLQPIPTLNWCKFLGTYLANGSFIIHTRKDRNQSIEYRTQIHTVKGQKHSVSGDQYTWIQQIISECNFKGQPRKDRHNISSRQLTEYVAQFGHAQDKFVPPEIFTWGADAAQAILEGLIGCDGHATESGSLGYTTTSKQLADDVQRLALHAGYAANIKKTIPDNPNWSARYTVGIVKHKLTPQINHGHAQTQNGQTERIIESIEPVWGITVPNHVLYVRVKGVPVWSGNSGRYGNKGVISRIIPDGQMIQDERGRPVDILMTSAGVVSRINPSQILETAIGKVVEKTGKPILVENFARKDNTAWAKKLLKEHGIKDKETVFDPVSGKKIPKVFVGNQYIMKLFKSTDTNYSARGVPDSYDLNQQPTKGGVHSAKVLGKMEFDALVGHNARNILKDAATIKSQKNDEYWRAIQLGYPTPPPRTSFAYNKFLNMLTGAGIKINRDKNLVSLAPLTDEDVLAQSSGEVKDSKIVQAKNLKPEIGGLFDPAITGGLKGEKWSHIALAEPVISPVFIDPVRRLLGLTTNQLNTELKEKGGAHIQRRLKRINVAEMEKELLGQMRRKKGTPLDSDVKKVKYLRALKSRGLTPDKAYIVSKIPVTPPVTRPVLPMQGSQQIIYGDANPLYQDLIYINNQLKDVKKNKILIGEEEKLRPVLQEAVGAVYGTNDPVTAKSQARGHKGFLTYLAGKGSPKFGYFQSKIMKRTQDVAGRGTIVPDSTLGIDEVGLPEDMLWSMYDKFVIRRLVQTGQPALQAKKMVKDRHPGARSHLMREIQERPVLINRAPTLHRYNILASTPKPIPGHTIRINPFIEKAQNADYDGDTMMVHVPVSPAAVEESKNLMLSNILFSDKSKGDLLVFPQHEAIMGINHAASLDLKNKPKVFKNKAEAMSAYNSGKIGLGTRVDIKEVL